MEGEYMRVIVFFMYICKGKERKGGERGEKNGKEKEKWGV